MKRAMLVTAILAVIANVGAAPYRLTFTGTYTESMVFTGPILGVTTLPAPFEYTIIYDTALNTNTHVFPAGSLMAGYPTIDSFFGYSASGILSTSLTFGTQTWNAGDIQSLWMSAAIVADLWFDTDLDVAAPTNFFVMFERDQKVLKLGTAALMTRPSVGSGVGYLAGASTVKDGHVSDGDYLAFDTTVEVVPLSPVPDSGVPLPIFSAVLLLLAAAGRRRT